MNVQPIPQYENTKKGSSAIAYVSIDADDEQPDHALFEPTKLATGGDEYWTERRHAITARRVLYTFLSYGLVTENHDSHSGLSAQGPGCGYYARDNVRTHIERVAQVNVPNDAEKAVNWMLLLAVKVWNPLVEQPNLLDTHTDGAAFKALLKQRLEGRTEIPRLCGLAIRGAVAGFPGV